MTSDTKEKEEIKSKSISGAVDKTKELAAKLDDFMKPVFDFAVLLIPYVIKYGQKAYRLWCKLDDNVITALIGLVFCFFGGIFPTLFSAIQAAEQAGRAVVVDAVKDLASEAAVIVEESKKDDKVDDNKDGIADVDQLSDKEYVKRKTLLVLQKMNPNKVDKAIQSIYTVWLSVMAVLCIQFARTIQMAKSISEFVAQPVQRFVAPVIKAATPDQYDKWVPVILGWITQAIGMSMAWTIASIQIAFASSMNGGLMLARSSYKALLKRNIRLGGLIVDNHEDTSIDEYASYVFAALGLLFQLSNGLSAPFPLNFILWPFQMAEWFVRASVMSASSGK
eukprot:CAMPEP_0113494074 /NCGR_PEP_ID=MMETSP0014_2-20120614/28921_1 /TAXON_ID=2857 /ORGANISM="Nitzschia sp." /LENGTH=335 /DNA_ID=CAMNT_0000387959 /DNA_START=183 /DNA_END=1190 /DNA_ORIENTATION=- /assembly_acc=CAM_ASM_000159